MKDIKDYIRTIPDFPQKGIMFRDITTLIQNADGLKLAVDSMCDAVSDLDYDVIAGAESRGFVFGAPMAYREHKPFVLIRKKGKLPAKTYHCKYDLEYGSAEIEVHCADVQEGQNILLVDDLVATGGTLKAAVNLVQQGKANVTDVFGVVGLPFLKYEEKLGTEVKVTTLVNYDHE